MAALSKHAILCIDAYALVRRRRRRRRNAQPQRVGRVWIKPHIGRHDERLREFSRRAATWPSGEPSYIRLSSSEIPHLAHRLPSQILTETGSAMCVSYASRKCFTVIGLWPVGWCDRCLWPAHTMQQLLDRFVFRIGPTTVAFVKSTDDDRLWCAHTMRQSSFRRLCVQQKTKIAWCVPGLRVRLGSK